MRMAADYRGFLMSGANEGYARAADPSEFLWPTATAMPVKPYVSAEALTLKNPWLRCGVLARRAVTAKLSLSPSLITLFHQCEQFI